MGVWDRTNRLDELVKGVSKSDVEKDQNFELKPFQKKILAMTNYSLIFGLMITVLVSFASPIYTAICYRSIAFLPED